MPTNLLNLPNYQITSVQDTEHDYHVYAETKHPPTNCPYCQASELVGFGRREQLIRDLPAQGRRVGVYVSTRRMQCRSCSKTFSEALPDVDERRAMTKRLLDWIGRQSVSRTFASLAEEVGVVEGTVRAIFRDYINELEAKVRFETPKWMGIDEIHIIKPRCVITNIQNNTVVNMLANRNKDTVARYLFELEKRDRIQYVAMDMWTPYRDAVRTVLPDAAVIVDKFHMVRMANVAMESVRKSIRADLSPKARRGLMHDRFVLLKRQRDLTDKEAFNLDGWTKNYPLLGEAYRLKEAFYGIYDAEGPEQALRAYEGWYKSIPPELVEHFQPIITAWRNWMPEIVNYFEHPVTNAYTESLNSLIRVMNRLGRGYSFEALRAKILFTEGAHSHKQKRPKFERRGVEYKERLDDKLAGGQITVQEPEEGIGYGIPSIRPPREPREYNPSTDGPKNYGADISTLVAMIEGGQL
ncbi:ISL3 family transposase [Duganella vulcania]|uniref:ISL3 family transposase n=1 Tax=Duganella vulcania TaxID=2692166 RepID=A0A845GHZ8_9BURK|nr:ISL3 family transposase [Duganella vulcania]MYM92678.1 ISL3 family transposase [Duganella vulcania]